MTTLSYHSYLITTRLIRLNEWSALVTLNGEEIYESFGMLSEQEAIDDAKQEIDLRGKDTQ